MDSLLKNNILNERMHDIWVELQSRSFINFQFQNFIIKLSFVLICYAGGISGLNVIEGLNEGSLSLVAFKTIVKPIGSSFSQLECT